jgi:hypothetical protein
VHEVYVGGGATPGNYAAMLGLSLAEAKAVLPGLPRHLVQAHAEEHCHGSLTPRTILSPMKEIMPDHCTPEYERVLAEFVALLP